MIKYPTNYGVGELCGNQVAVHECYIAMMKMDNHLQTMNIEEHQTTIEHIERIEEIFLYDSRNDRPTRVGTPVNSAVCQALATFFRENHDVFA